ncbi:hypothetical protein IJT17_00855 [bacterium]|nr:hypothetical protein [bacterium]
MAEPDGLKHLQTRLSSVKTDIRDSLARQAEMEKKNLWLTWGIVIVVVGFMFAGYATIKANFTPEKVQESLVAQGPEMVAGVSEAVSEAASEVIPVYYTEIQNKTVEIIPEVSEALEKELNTFGEETNALVEKQLSSSLKRIEDKQKQNLKQLFPDLKDEDIEKMLDNILKDTEGEVEGLTGYILSKTVGDIIALDKTIKAFDTKNLPDQEYELSRQLAHHFLLLLDEELMEMQLDNPSKDKKGAK